jgi:hypothetical protein
LSIYAVVYTFFSVYDKLPTKEKLWSQGPMIAWTFFNWECLNLIIKALIMPYLPIENNTSSQKVRVRLHSPFIIERQQP